MEGIQPERIVVPVIKYTCSLGEVVQAGGSHVERGVRCSTLVPEFKTKFPVSLELVAPGQTDQVAVVPAGRDVFCLLIRKSGMVERIAKDTKETLGQFLLCQKFNTICLAFSSLADGLSANAAKLCSLVGEAHPIQQTYGIV